MKIRDILQETDNKAVITNYQPGKSVEVKMADGTIVKKDLASNPTALSNDPQGNPIFNLNSTAPQGATPTKSITPGTQIDVNTDSLGQTSMGETQEEEENDDLIGSGKDGIIGGPSGGDKTDDLIHDVTDKEFEQHARGDRTTSNSENDELNRWLTIARLK